MSQPASSSAFARLRIWLDQVPIADPVLRQQARGVQAFLLVLIVVFTLLALPLSLVSASSLAGVLFNAIGIGLALLMAIVGLVLLRRGAYYAGLLAATLGVLIAIVPVLIPSGITNSRAFFLALLIPITLAGLAGGRRELLINLGAAIGLLVLTAILELRDPPLAGFVPFEGDVVTSAVATSITMLFVLGFLFDRFGMVLRTSLRQALDREADLSRLRDSLEQTVAQRTDELQRLLAQTSEREQQLSQTLNELRESREAVRELSAPILPVLPAVLVMPLIGSFDDQRARLVLERALDAVERQRARVLILDITGLPIVDTYQAQVLNETAKSVQLLGAEVMLVGVRPEVAQTIVSLGAGLTIDATFADLQAAVGSIVERRARGLLRSR